LSVGPQKHKGKQFTKRRQPRGEEPYHKAKGKRGYSSVSNGQGVGGGGTCVRKNVDENAVGGGGFLKKEP